MKEHGSTIFLDPFYLDCSRQLGEVTTCSVYGYQRYLL